MCPASGAFSRDGRELFVSGGDRDVVYLYGWEDGKVNKAWLNDSIVLAFETDTPADFLDLVQEMRETEASSYTLRDTPIFTCVLSPIRDVLASLAGETKQTALA